MPENHFGPDVAATYDDSGERQFDPVVIERTVDVLAHLEPGGRFVVEVGVPDPRRLPPGSDARVFSHAPGYVGYDRYTDLVAQQATSHHVRTDGSSVRELRTPFRFVWPSELDLMARIAGMELEHRWADWDRSPFTGDSTSHVSIWRRPIGSAEDHGGSEAGDERCGRPS